MFNFEVRLQKLPLFAPTWLKEFPLPVQVLVFLLITSLISISCFILYLFALTLYRLIRANILHNDGYDHFPQPKHQSKYWSMLFGDLKEIQNANPVETHIRWSRELGSDVICYRTIFYQNRLLISDAKAIHYILNQQDSYHYPKPNLARKVLSNLLGNGLLVAEGECHKRQRKVLQPAFNISSLRAFTPTFFHHANRFTRTLGHLVDQSKGFSLKPFIEGQSVQCALESQFQKPALDIMHWFSRMTLDIIGDTGFDHQFDSVRLPLDQQTDSIGSNFRTLIHSTAKMAMIDKILIALGEINGLHWVSMIPTARKRMVKRVRASLDKTGTEIIQRKRKEVKDELDLYLKSGLLNEKQFFDEQEESKGKAKDLLFLMIKANMAPGIKENERLQDSELLGQITTLLMAGHETTSTFLSWFVYLTSKPENQDVLMKLRLEIDEYFSGIEELDYDTLMAMPFLDNCVKEVLRLISPVPETERYVNQDDVIPLGKSYPTRDGKSTFNSIHVKKGDSICIPIQVINRSINIWGPDADEFRPDRWDNIPKRAKETGFPMHILSFIEGPRGCIGNRFAIVEAKAIICALLRSFEYESLGWQIEPKHGVVVRPRVVEQEELGTQLPIRLQRRK